MALLEVQDLSVAFGNQRVVDDLSLSLNSSEALAIVGESGCGKSMTALALMRLLAPDAKATGRILLDGQNLLELPEKRMRQLRGKRMGIVFQDPMSALNPVLTVAEQLIEAVAAHESLSSREAKSRALELLELVQIPDAARRLNDYPHQFSGGMRQRVAIAIAIASRPEILIADEPTTALDVTIQAQILALISDLKQELGMGLILVTHDLGVVAETADRVLVMYAGRKVEEQSAEALFDNPLHPYTRKLIASKPRLQLGNDLPSGRPGRLQEIPGLVPLPGHRGQGCAFAARCDRTEAKCRIEPPRLRIDSQRAVACHMAHFPTDSGASAVAYTAKAARAVVSAHHKGAL